MDFFKDLAGQKDFTLYGYVGTSIVVAYGIYYILQVWMMFRKCNLPMAGMEDGFIKARKAFSTNAWDFLEKAYSKYGDDVPFLLPALDKPRAVLPARYMEDIKNLTNDISDRDQAVYEESLGKYVGFTHMDTVTQTHFKVVKNQLGHKLGDVIKPIASELAFGFQEDTPAPGKTATIEIFPLILKIMARADAKVFVGMPLCRDPEWIESSINFTELTFRASMELVYFGPIFRPLFWWLSPSLKALKAQKKRNKAVVTEEMNRRIEAERKAKEAGIEWAERPDDMLQWLWEAAEPAIKNPDSMGELLMTLNIAAIHTSGMFVTHAIYDLLSNPEYIQPLREEMKQALEEEGGIITKRALDKMKKMDSFLKESQRMNSIGAVLVSRLMRQDIQLSNGFVLPAGTIASSAQHFIHMDEKYYPNPKKFDGFRFERMQAEGQGLEKNGVPTRLTSTAGCSLAFGVGRRVCSGRFLAGAKAKMIFIELLRGFDLSLEKPEEGRPKNMYVFSGACVPDPFAKVVMKKLRDEERYF